MAKIKMLVDDKGSPNGSHVVDYAKGQTYDVPAELAEAFVLHRKSAVMAEEGDAPAESKTGAEEGDAPAEA